MVGQVKVVSILMMVQGGLAILMGLLQVVGSAANLAGVGSRPPGNETLFNILFGLQLLLGLAVLVVGPLTIFAGIKASKFQSRKLALVALFANILPIFTCYCAPTSLAVMIYGLIVMFNAQVAEAFQLGEQGTPPEQIIARYSPPRPTA